METSPSPEYSIVHRLSILFDCCDRWFKNGDLSADEAVDLYIMLADDMVYEEWKRLNGLREILQ